LRALMWRGVTERGSSAGVCGPMNRISRPYCLCFLGDSCKRWKLGGRRQAADGGRTYNKSYVKHHLYRAACAACAACAVRRMKRTEAGIAIISSSYVPSSGRRRSHSRLVGNLLSPRSSLYILIARPHSRRYLQLAFPSQHLIGL
jgi:hypothetical protein